jgi:hypothetical protein
LRLCGITGFTIREGGTFEEALHTPTTEEASFGEGVTMGDVPATGLLHTSGVEGGNGMETECIVDVS